jgi:type VI secretion system protein ImpE
MSAVEALRDGDLSRALADLQTEVRSSPDEPRHRVFLFQLLSVLGQWDRALTQLRVARDLDPGAIMMAQAYEPVLRCEVLRQQVFAGQRTPLLLGDPEPWMAPIVEALKFAARGDWAAFRQLRDQAYEAAPATGGTLRHVADPTNPSIETEASFEWLADGDTRLGPILEVIINGCYYWVPLSRIARVDIEPPADLRDFVWLPARFLWTNQGEAFGMIPTRYPGSETAQDPQVQLGRRTDWREPAEGVYEGLGQRVLVTDEAEYAIMNVRRIELAGAV